MCFTRFVLHQYYAAHVQDTKSSPKENNCFHSHTRIYSAVDPQLGYMHFPPRYIFSHGSAAVFQKGDNPPQLCIYIFSFFGNYPANRILCGSMHEFLNNKVKKEFKPREYCSVDPCHILSIHHFGMQYKGTLKYHVTRNICYN